MTASTSTSKRSIQFAGRTQFAVAVSSARYTGERDKGRVGDEC